MLTYNLDSRGSKNLYEALYGLLRDDIVSGRLCADEHLPSKRDFAHELGVSVITVEHAYGQLVAEGYVRAEQRRGYFVNNLDPVLARGGVSLHVRPAVVQVPLPEQPAVAKAAYDFTGSGILPGSFPYRAWQGALKDVLETRDDAQLLAPAPAAGHMRLRCAIAKHIREYRGIDASPECVVVGAGAQTLYSFLIQLIGHTGRVAVESPGYPRLSSFYQSAGMETCFIGMDQQGASVEELERSGARLVHIMPSHHFPTGVVMPVSRRYELLGWAAQGQDRYIAEDDYDCEFRHVGRPIPALQSIDVSEKVIYLNTFSKTLAPGMRISYMVLPPHLMERFNTQLGFYSSSVSSMNQLALAGFMESGQFDRHVNRMRRLYRANRDVAMEVLDTHGLRGCVSGEDAGLHFVLSIPDAQAGQARHLAERLLQKDVSIRPLDWYCGAGPVPQEALIVNYAALDSEQTRQGVELIAQEMLR